MKTRISIVLIFTLFNIQSFAQSPSDALNFSQTFNGGTARFVSMGGAFGALGGDFGSLSYNPAGLGIYRTSEFTFTPSFKNRSITSDYNGMSGNDSKSRFYFDNLGFVFSFKPYKDADNGLINFNLGFGFNRTNDFNSNAIARGNNSDNSMMDYIAGLASGNNYFDLTDPDDNTYNPFLDSNAPWEAIMAWNTFLIDTATGSNGQDYWAALNPGDGVAQQKVISTSGLTGEYTISVGANISNKVYFGATLGISDINIKTSSTYSEDAFTSNGYLPNGDRFNYSDYNQTIETNGSGYNLKLGVIFKPIEGLRLGYAFHTPTYYKLEDTYSYSLFSSFDYGTSESKTPNSRYDYQLETPFKSIGSIAYVFQDLGLLSLDVEKVNYSKMRFREGGDGYSYTSENQDINDIYRNVYNLKVGGEVRIDKMFLRAGYAYYGSPYKSGYLNEDSNRKLISGGIGYRSGNFFIDAAYLYTLQNEKYIFYNLSNADGSLAINPVSTKMTEGKFLMTVGFKF
ncbi:MAG: OmpP1/FadL family transporter [Tenuifilaceae bacterium]